MDALFEDLCESAELTVACLERQLTLSVDQCRAIRARDFETVEAKATDLTAVNADARRADVQTKALLAEISTEYRIPAHRVSLDTAAKVAPDGWSARLQDAGERIASVNKDLREVALAGTVSLQKTADAIMLSMESLRGCVELTPPEAVLNPQPQPSAVLS
ncbi:MAG: hypothetical protein GY851_21410 [bacterium]|nr:hypothetical protein [bacterium]